MEIGLGPLGVERDQPPRQLFEPHRLVVTEHREHVLEHLAGGDEEQALVHGVEVDRRVLVAAADALQPSKVTHPVGMHL